jgi:hydroxymethylglutaryl-CoA synthase
MFAYGSGLAASMFRLRAVRDLPKNPELFAVLASRIKISPEEYTRRMLEREKNYEKKNFTTVDSLTELRPGTVYLEKVDDRWRRFYKRVDNRPRI